ncbi:unnamed protein product [Rotaria sordida]|uniref:ISXO2-like transposase domain-containing protein n=1 Tax=Rotaria sordida TaxID=392033 RepID=A0A816AP10_9BILA|nr:unnamed protein product [Rotaria sordida]CAF1598226.1 unnamed protein product [Rotaria sordida]
MGDASGWTIGGGSRANLFTSDLNPAEFLPGGFRGVSSIGIAHSSIVTNGNDPILGTLMPNIVYGGNFAWRVEDTAIGGYVSVLSQDVSRYYCTDIYFAWLAVLENGEHIAEQSSLLIIELEDMTTGTTLHSDEWKAYNSLRNNPNYTHVTVNHSASFVDSITGVHTRNIENTWMRIKQKQKKQNGLARTLLPTYLEEFVWRQDFGDKPLKNLILQISENYPVQ